MKIIKQHGKGAKKVGIVRAEDWFSMSGTTMSHVSFAFLKESYIVGEYFEYSNGENSTYEGLRTIAACVELRDAMILFNHYCFIRDVEDVREHVNSAEFEEKKTKVPRNIQGICLDRGIIDKPHLS